LLFFQTAQLGQMQPFCWTDPPAFALAQNNNPLRRDSLKVGQPGQMHAFAFSGLSATITPILKTPPHSCSTKIYREKINAKEQFDFFGENS